MVDRARRAFQAWKATVHPPVMVATPAMVGTVDNENNIKLSNLIDPASDADLVMLDPITVRRMFATYQTLHGEFPHKDIEPTGEQLSAVAQLICNGIAPYVDFSVFRPHGRRAATTTYLCKLHFPAVHGHLEETGAGGSSRPHHVVEELPCLPHVVVAP
eukprot:12095928-Heterocapsa_arctica.AAC.1